MIGTPEAGDWPASADVAIIGGGIVGAATAFYTERAGLRTLVLERRGGLATLTTPRSLESFRAQFDDAASVAMMRESIAVFEHLGEVLGRPGYDISLRQQGYLFVTSRPDGPQRLRARVARQQALGLDDVELMDGGEARRRFPYLAQTVTAASFRARDGWLASHEVTYGFAAASGARFFLDTEVTALQVRSGRVVGLETNRGRVDTPRAVIAAGPYSGRVAALAGVQVPLWPVRRHRAGIKRDDRIPGWAPMTVSLDSGAHWRPEGPGAFLAWAGAMDEPAGEPRDEVPADWTFPARVLEAVALFSPFWEDVASDLRRDNVTLEAGQYTMTPDDRPAIGACSEVDGLYLNAGYCGHGVMGSPAGGRLAADAIARRLDESDNPFSPSRFERGSRLLTEKDMVL